MLTRAISGAVFVILMIGSLVFGFTSSLVLFSILAAIGTLEFYKLAQKQTRNTYKYLGSAFSGLLVLLSGYSLLNGSTYWIFSVWMVFAIAFVFQVLRSKSETSIIDISVTISGALYLAVPFICLLILGIYPSLSATNFNWQIPLSIFILTWTNDTGAYLSGRTFGKTKLFERISPNKTWEGSIGGAIFTLGGALVIHHFWGLFSIPVWTGAALLISVFANIGDLMESAFKRNAGVKDSGKIMPGHGGILDRFDAILLTAPVVLAYLLSLGDI